MMNRPNEEEQLTMVVKILLPIYHYLFVQYFLNFKALIAAGTQIKDAINNGTKKIMMHLSLERILGLVPKLQKSLIYI